MSMTMRTQSNLFVVQLGERDKKAFDFFVLNPSLDTFRHLKFSKIQRKREVVVMGKYGFNRKLLWVTYSLTARNARCHDMKGSSKGPPLLSVLGQILDGTPGVV